MQEIDFAEKRSLKEWFADNSVGIYVTIIFHLVVLLLLTINGIHTKLNAPPIEIILVHQEMPPEEKPIEEKPLEEVDKVEELEKEVQQMIDAALRPSVSLPNIAVNAGAKGDESGGGGGGGANMTAFTEPVQPKSEPEPKPEPEPKEEQTNTSAGVDDLGSDKKSGSGSDKAYQGPSIVSYLLEGRSAIYMPVPAYKCRAGGDVTVIIEVNKLGYVTNVEIDKKASSRNDCLQEAAKAAASMARFTTSPDGLPGQKGNIVYRFIAQG